MSTSVATLVEMTAPPGQALEKLKGEMAATMAADQKTGGLIRKHFIVSESGTYGSLSIWKDEASARKGLGAGSTVVEWFDVPILTPGLAAGRSLPAETMIAQTR